MTTVSMNLLDSGSKATLDVEFNIIVDEECAMGPNLYGRVEMNVLKPMHIYALGAFVGTFYSIKLKTPQAADANAKKKGKSSSAPNVQTRMVAGPYTPWPEHCNIFILANKERDQATPLLYSPGLYTFLFRFNLKSLGTLANFEFKNARGETLFQNRIYLCIVTATLAHGKAAYYTRGFPVNLPNFPPLGKSWTEPVERKFSLKKGRQDVAEYSLTLNQQAYNFGDSVEFKVEKAANLPDARAREVTVSLVRNVTVEVEGPAKFSGVRCYREMKRIVIERKILASKTFRSDENFYEGSLLFPEGPSSANGTPIECSYKVELSVNLFGQMSALKGVIGIDSAPDGEDARAGKALESFASSFPAQSLTSLASLFGKEFNLDTISLASFPPDYSLLSSRSTSFESLPPAYSEVESGMKGLGLGTSPP